MNQNPHSLKYQLFAYLYKQYSLPLMKFIFKKMGGQTEAAEEVFSQSIEAALKGWHTFNHKSKFFTWVCKIALNKMADYYRQLINQKSKLVAPSLEFMASIPSPQLTPEEKLALDELKLAVHKCLILLPEEKRKLLYLRYWKDMSLQKIAELMNTTERAAEGKIYRAKRELRAIILQKYPDLAYSIA